MKTLTLDSQGERFAALEVKLGRYCHLTCRFRPLYIMKDQSTKRATHWAGCALERECAFPSRAVKDDFESEGRSFSRAQDVVVPSASAGFRGQGKSEGSMKDGQSRFYQLF